MTETVFTNADIVLRDDIVRGTLVIRDGTIADIDTGRSSLAGAVDLDGDYVIPGLIELHTDNLERHATPRPNSHWPIAHAVLNHDRELVGAGITTVHDALAIGHADRDSRQGSVPMDMAAMLEKQSAAGTLKADHYIHLRCEVSSPDICELAEPLLESPRTRLVSVMDHTPGQRQFISEDMFRSYYKSKYHFTDDEIDQFIARRKRDQELYSDRNRRRIVAVAHERNLPVASHDDATVAHVEEAVADQIVVAEFPTTREAARACREHGLAVLMGAPNVVRGKSHSGNVSARTLAEDGLLDILSSDYVPASLLFGAVTLFQSNETISLPDAVSLVTSTPAKRVGLDDRGEIAAGKRADLVRFRLNGDMPEVIEVWREGGRVA